LVARPEADAACGKHRRVHGRRQWRHRRALSQRTIRSTEGGSLTAIALRELRKRRPHEGRRLLVVQRKSWVGLCDAPASKARREGHPRFAALSLGQSTRPAAAQTSAKYKLMMLPVSHALLLCIR
jgi:hypothetical protein